MREGHAVDKKFKKFFRITIPILVVEVIAAIVLVTYLILLPKNYCKVKTNVDYATVYINNKSTNKIRLGTPQELTQYNLYEFDVTLVIEQSGDYQVTYTVNCDKYSSTAETDFSKEGKTYKMSNVKGNSKILLMKGINVISKEELKNFEVVVDVTITKLSA